MGIVNTRDMFIMLVLWNLWIVAGLLDVAWLLLVSAAGPSVLSSASVDGWYCFFCLLWCSWTFWYRGVELEWLDLSGSFVMLLLVYIYHWLI